MPDPLTFAIVGCGDVTGRSRAENFADAENAEVGVTMDIVEELAQDIAERFDVPWTTDYDEVLENPDIDVVYLSLPHDLHAPQTIKAAEAGKHVLVEKPIATTVAEADEMIEACEREGVTLGVFLSRRYGARHNQVRDLVSEGAIGDVVGTEIEIMVHKDDSYWEGGYSGRAETDWRQHKDRSGGGVLSINGIHNVDALREITDLEAERVYAEYDTFATDVEVEDFVSVTMRYDNGAIGTIHASTIARREPREEVIKGDRVYGTEGTIVASSPIRIRTLRDDEYGDAGEWSTIEVESDGSSGHPLIDDYVRSVQAGEPPRITGEEAMRSLEVVEAAYRSGETNEPVELPLER